MPVIMPTQERRVLWRPGSTWKRSACKAAAAVQMLSQDLLNASLQIPFSVPPYMSLLARAVATLEGIALSGDPNYQMVAEVSQLPLPPIPCAST